MTREEAINIISQMIKDEEGFLSDNTVEAHKMAIQALEQEPTVAQERYEDLCEYFGDAKDILNNREDFKAWLARVKWHIHKAEELYEKYEKEPCEDAIRRQAAIETIFEQGSAEKLEIDFAKLLLLQRAIKALPPVTPQPKIGKWISVTETWMMEDLENQIKEGKGCLGRDKE